MLYIMQKFEASVGDCKQVDRLAHLYLHEWYGYADTDNVSLVVIRIASALAMAPELATDCAHALRSM